MIRHFSDPDVDLILKPLADGSFKLISGKHEDFQRLVEMQTFYDNHTTKQPISVEDAIFLSELVSKVLNGPEQGMYTSEQWETDLRNLKGFFLNRGYKFYHQLLWE